MKPLDLVARFKFACRIKTGRLLDDQGNQYWFFHWKEHRDGAPAFISAGGTKKWYRYGELHRDGGPAIERPNGEQEYYRNGQRHREDGPAIIRLNGENEWWKNGARWEDKSATDKIEATQKEQALAKVTEEATVVKNEAGVKPLKTVRFKKPGA